MTRALSPKKVSLLHHTLTDHFGVVLPPKLFSRLSAMDAYVRRGVAAYANDLQSAISDLRGAEIERDLIEDLQGELELWEDDEGSSACALLRSMRKDADGVVSDRLAKVRALTDNSFEEFGHFLCSQNTESVSERTEHQVTTKITLESSAKAQKTRFGWESYSLGALTGIVLLLLTLMLHTMFHGGSNPVEDAVSKAFPTSHHTTSTKGDTQ